MRKTTMWRLAVLAGLALAFTACGGNDGDNPAGLPTGGEAQVTVTVVSGAPFNGYDLLLDYNETRLTPVSPLTSAAAPTGLATGAVCQVQTVVGGRIRLSCIKASSMTGPGDIALFRFTYSSGTPGTGDFTPSCSFVDQNGAPVASLTCSFRLSL